MIDFNKIFSERLRRARIMKGFSMDELCEKMEKQISKQAISKYERGLCLPGSSNLILLCNALEVSPDYFFKKSDVSIGNIEFRKKSRLGAKNEDSIRESIRDNMEKYMEIEELCGANQGFVNPLDSFEVTSESDVYDAVDKLKDVWRIGQDGILSVTDLLESKNIKIVELNVDLDFDGLSGIVNNNPQLPFIVLNNCIVERMRFTAMHELGHLVLQFEDSVSQKEREKLCHLFANEMLISKEVFIDKVGVKRKEIYLQELKELQFIYGISIDALMIKAKYLGIITESSYKGFCIKKSRSKYFKTAVEESRYNVMERSTRFDMLVYRALADDLISTSKAAVLLDVSIDKVINSMESMY